MPTVTLSGKLFAFAGLWERWSPPDCEAIESFTILTTDANELTKPIHDRMPVIVDPADFSPWLDPAEKPTAVQGLLRAYPPDAMEAYPVSTFVDKVRNKGPQCVEPLAQPWKAANRLFFFWPPTHAGQNRPGLSHGLDRAADGPEVLLQFRRRHRSGPARPQHPLPQLKLLHQPRAQFVSTPYAMPYRTPPATRPGPLL
jgi:hypothetical protein